VIGPPNANTGGFLQGDFSRLACPSNPSGASAFVNPNSSKQAGFSLCKNVSLAIRHDISGIAGIP
jgi:hypothetical protein